MDSTQLIIIAAVIIFFVLKKLGQVSPAQARELVAAGALIVDVRSPGEFAEGHLASAVNIPLDVIGQQIGAHVKDKNQPILVYCLSGSRSALAKRILKGQGFSGVHNLGSIFRARSIVGE
ncbi:MAG TPA: rhodanese-like domain-containing protein [Candidatus Rifleibacterium sp.]|nr:rhodanese-like domain-containing protein [Candidatus Rifleibacterium sp.]HPW59001.1 rhodanese-like domain-containing protein [Candidatus Rifleibacterium sp.]HQB84428.1 rhodanese-like domain-containing protein [Candidatus Rifleibacterium sp.]